MSTATPRSVAEYLQQLRTALAGADPALVQDALYDAEEHLRGELRENRDVILKSSGAADEIELLERIYTSQLPEHPSYEQYLSARILADTRETVRAMLSECLKEARRT